MLKELRLSCYKLFTAFKSYRFGKITAHQFRKEVKSEVIILVITSMPYWPDMSVRAMKLFLEVPFGVLIWKINTPHRSKGVPIEYNRHQVRQKKSKPIQSVKEPKDDHTNR